jgi:hypothetical protein
MFLTNLGLGELQEKEMDRIKNKWDFLIQCRPDIRAMIGNSKLIGGDISHNSSHEVIFNFITNKGTFSYNEMTDEFKSKFQIR